MIGKLNNFISLFPKRALAFALAVILLVGAFTGGCGGEVRAEDNNVLDFAALYGEIATAPQGDIVSGLMGTGISEVEREYLNAHSKYSVLFTSDVPAEHCVAAVTNGKICALALPYSYTAANGQTVNWLPVFAQVEGGEPVPLVWSDRDEAYCAYLDGGGGKDVTFTYVATVTLPENVALDMANEAYAAAVEMEKALAEFEEDHRVWSEADERYREYLAKLNAYDLAKEAYKKYKDDLVKYDAELLKYQTWWNEYDAQKALYDQYVLKYDKFLANREEIRFYDEQLEAYREYMELVNASPELKAEYEEKAQAAQGHLNVIDSFYKDITPTGHSFYGVVTSSLVYMVIANKAEIETIGGNAEDVDNAERASYYLGEIFGAYKSLSSDSERYEYAFGKMEDIKTYLTMLRTSLENLANVKAIMDRIVKEGFKDEFFEFMGIMYYCECAVYNEKTFDINATYKGSSMSVLLDANALAKDTDSLVRLESGWPTPPTTSDDVDPVEHPGIRPAPMDEPDEVAPPPDKDMAPEKPQRPQDVEDPGDVPPDEVASAGDEPEPPVTDALQDALLEAYKNGKIAYRKSVASCSAQISSSTTARSKTVRILVSAYDGDRQIANVYVLFGGSAENMMPYIADKTVDGREYKFVGWSPTPNGMPIDLSYISSATGTLSLYAVFKTFSLPTTETETETETEADITETETETETETDEGTNTEATTDTDTLQTSEETTVETTEETTVDITEQTSDVTEEPITAISTESTCGSTSQKEPDNMGEDTLDLTVPTVSLWARLLGKMGLVPLLITVGALVGVLVAGGVIAVVVIIDKKRR